MPSITPITVNDRKDPVQAHTFEPQSPNGGVARWHEPDSQGVVLGDNLFTLSKSETANRQKTVCRLTLPQLSSKTDGGATTFEVARVIRVNIELSVDKESTSSERADAVEILRNLLAADTTLINDALVNGRSIY